MSDLDRLLREQARKVYDHETAFSRWINRPPVRDQAKRPADDKAKE
jgi:hypothetical protein